MGSSTRALKDGVTAWPSSLTAVVSGGSEAALFTVAKCGNFPNVRARTRG